MTSVITTPVKPGVTLHALFTGEILGSTPPGTTPTGATVGGAFNLVNLDGVSAFGPVLHRAVGRDLSLAVLGRRWPWGHGADQGLPNRG